MRDIRRHGQEVTLTLTMDCVVPDDHIRVIARQLKPFGRLRLRLNHECDGFWFAFNRRYSYSQVADFFVRFAGVMKKEAPQIQMMCCWGHSENLKKAPLRYEKELAPTLKASDLWSTDKYLSLHHGWPAQACEPEDIVKTYNIHGIKNVWGQMKAIHRRFCELAGEDRGLELGELNADGNVGGEEYRFKLTRGFYQLVLREKPAFLKGITYYQFRDRSRLGLEREDPNNPCHGVPTPFLDEYRQFIQDAHFRPKESWNRLKSGLRMEWRASEDSDGLGWKLTLKKKPIFLELLLDKKANLMVWAGKRWFYKKPGVEWVDVTEEAVRWGQSKPFPIRVFAPPAEGVNPGGATQVVSKLSKPPQVRIRYDWNLPKKKAHL
jgi:hypothetical protein